MDWVQIAAFCFTVCCVIHVSKVFSEFYIDFKARRFAAKRQLLKERKRS